MRGRITEIPCVVFFLFCAFALLPQPGRATVTATVTVRSGPVGVAVTPSGAYAYVTNYGDNTVWVINVVPAVSVSPTSGTLDVGARCFVPKMVKNGYKSDFVYLSLKWTYLTNAF